MLSRVGNWRAMTALGTLCVSRAILAADTAAPVIGGMRGQPDIGLPSMTRVIVAVVITLGLMVGGLVALKRFMPNITMRRTPGNLVKVLGRAHITPSLQAHVLEIDAARVLVVEGRRGLSVTILTPDADSRSTDTNTPSP